MRLLVTSALTFVALLAAGAETLGWYSSRHHLPQQQMNDARGAGDGCFLFLGDSRMVAALDANAFHRELRRIGHDRCHVQLAIGATDVGGMYLAAREYLSSGRVPLAAVIGKVGDSLLGSVPVRPEDMIGNNAIHLIWSRPGDVFDEVPGFPGDSIATFDAGLRFLAARATPLGRYQSLVSIRTQRLGAFITGNRSAPQNRFGALGDMASLEDTLRARGRVDLDRVAHGSDDDRYGRWFGRLVELLRQHGVAPVVVELPMRQAYRVAVTTTPQAAAYQGWLADQLARGGGALFDLSAAPWVKDDLFGDELHLSESGAALASMEMAKDLGPLFPRGSL
jgi:hypothetical protein